MARSLLGSFVSGTRQMLAVQLFASVGAVALAGYTVAVTNNAIRERDRLAERVIVLEEALGQAGVAPPQAAPIPDAPTETLYPPSLEQSTDVTPELDGEAPPANGATTAPPVAVVEQPVEPHAPERPPPQTPNETPGQTAPPQNADGATVTPQAPAFDPTQVLRDLLTPPPPLRTIVLHVRARTDVDEAQRVARALSANGMAVSIDIMPANDPRQSGYSYYHGRQSRPAAEAVQRVQDAARSAEIAAWSVQLRGTALPASGEYSADRLDVVLPPLPAEQPGVLRVNPQILRNRAVTQPPVQQQPQEPVIR